MLTKTFITTSYTLCDINRMNYVFNAFYAFFIFDFELKVSLNVSQIM